MRNDNSIRSTTNQKTVRIATIVFTLLVIARSTSFLMSKELLESMQPLNLLGVRFFLAFLILFSVFHRRVINEIKTNPAVLKSAFMLGLAYFLCMTSELYGLRDTTSSVCSFLENSAIVIVPFMSAILERKAPKPLTVICTLITMVGIGLIALRGSMSLGKGELLCMLAAFFFACGIIITDRVSNKSDALSLGIIYVGMLGLMALISAFFIEGDVHLPQTGHQWLLLLGLAVICTGFGFTIQPVAQSKISVETAGVLFALNPLTAAVLGWLVRGEALGVKGIIGAGLIILSIVMMNILPSRIGHASKVTCSGSDISSAKKDTIQITGSTN